jgi:hypothetical protein
MHVLACMYQTLSQNCYEFRIQSLYQPRDDQYDTRYIRTVVNLKANMSRSTSNRQCLKNYPVKLGPRRMLLLDLGHCRIHRLRPAYAAQVEFDRCTPEGLTGPSVWHHVRQIRLKGRQACLRSDLRPLTPRLHPIAIRPFQSQVGW